MSDILVMNKTEPAHKKKALYEKTRSGMTSEVIAARMRAGQDCRRLPGG
jgi:hypothetical protein